MFVHFHSAKIVTYFQTDELFNKYFIFMQNVWEIIIIFSGKLQRKQPRYYNIK